MVDYTREPEANDLQTILNTWTEGSYSPVHKHTDYAETFVVLEGTLLFFTWGAEGDRAPATCHVLSSEGPNKGIIVEKVTLAPRSPSRSRLHLRSPLHRAARLPVHNATLPFLRSTNGTP